MASIDWPLWRQWWSSRDRQIPWSHGSCPTGPLASQRRGPGHLSSRSPLNSVLEPSEKTAKPAVVNNWRLQGQDYFRIMKATGPKTLSVFRRYNTVFQDELKALVGEKI